MKSDLPLWVPYALTFTQRWRWRVVPVQTYGTRYAVKPLESAREATDAPRQILAWGDVFPHASVGVGLVCGERSKVYVLEVNKSEAGSEALAVRRRNGQVLPPTASFGVGAKYEYHLFTASAYGALDEAYDVDSGCRLLGEGSIVSLPLGATAHAYAPFWLRHIDEVGVQPLPAWLAEAAGVELAPEEAHEPWLQDARRLIELGFTLAPLYPLGSDDACTCAAERSPDRMPAQTPARGKPPAPCAFADAHVIGELQEEATREMQTVRTWRDFASGVDLGAATGFGSRVVAVEVDPAEGGAETLERLVGRMPKTPCFVARGGQKVYLFTAHVSQPYPCLTALGDGVRLLGDGNVVRLPPLTHCIDLFTPYWVDVPGDAAGGASLAPLPAALHPPLSPLAARSSPVRSDALQTITAADFGRFEAPTWLCDRLVASGGVTTVAAPPLSSLSTLYSLNLLRALLTGTPFLGRRTRATKGLFLSDASLPQLKELVTDARLLELLEEGRFGLVSHSLVGQKPWRALLETCIETCLEMDGRLLVIDSADAFLPQLTGEDAGVATAVLEVLRAGAREGLAVVLTTRSGRAARSLTAFADAAGVLERSDVFVRLQPTEAHRDAFVAERVSRLDRHRETIVATLQGSRIVHAATADPLLRDPHDRSERETWPLYGVGAAERGSRFFPTLTALDGRPDHGRPDPGGSSEPEHHPVRPLAARPVRMGPARSRHSVAYPLSASYGEAEPYEADGHSAPGSDGLAGAGDFGGKDGLAGGEGADGAFVPDAVPVAVLSEPSQPRPPRSRGALRPSA